MSTDTGGPAFPVLDYITPEKVAAYKTGMTLRDYFAAKVMHALLVDKPVTSLHGAEHSAVAMMAYRQADAMLKARNT
jgi:hypothetical protein